MQTILTLLAVTAPHYGLAAFRDDYDKTYAALEAARDNNALEAAALEFEKLASRPEAGEPRANAMYWAAEGRYRQEKYLQALVGFEKVLAIPKSNKEEAARFKVAMCQVKLQWNEGARWELSRFMRDYPGSNLTELVRAELERLEGGN